MKRRRPNPPSSALVGALTLAVAGAMLLPATGAGAVAGLQDDQLSSGTLEEIDRRIPLLKATKTKFTRVDVLWNQVAETRPVRPRDPNDPAYDWSRHDRIVCGLARASIGRLFTVYSAPAWATKNGKGAPEGSEVNPYHPRLNAYRDFMFAISKRYSGNFRPKVKDETCRAAKLPRVRHWEVWQEPHIEKTLKPQYKGRNPVGFKLYVQMTRKAYGAIKTGNGRKNRRRAVVIAGVGAPRSSNNRKGFSASVWMKKLLRSNARMDMYSQHLYPGVAPRKPSKAIPSWHTLPKLLKEIDKVKKRRGMKLIVSESGYTTKRGVRTGKRAVVNKRVQARNLTQQFNLKIAKNPRIPLIMWFQLADNPFWFSGLYEGDALGNPVKKKPAYGAFVREARKTKRLPILLRP